MTQVNPHIRKVPCSRCGAECWNVVAIGMYAVCLYCFKQAAGQHGEDPEANPEKVA